MRQQTTLFIAVAAFFLASCSLTVPNIEVCRDKGPLGARCAFTNSGPSRDIPLETWEIARFGQFCMKEDAFAKNQLFFEQACELIKNCKVEEVKAAYRALMTTLREPN